MGGATLPTPSTPGYTSFRGRTTCVCLAAWLPVYERLLLAQGLIKSNIDVWQLTGGAPASGGTHTQGGAFDLLYQTGAPFVASAREMGAQGTWGRTKSQGFTADHLHGVLSGCPHNGPAAYQIVAQQRGYSGLGRATSGQYAGMWGYGSRDTYPNPSARRSWEQGIAWAQKQIDLLSPKPAPTPAPAPVPEEDIMASIDDLKAAIRSEVGKAVWAYPLENRYTKDKWSAGSYVEGGSTWSAQAREGVARLTGEVAGLSKALEAIQSGAPVDLEAITAAAQAGAQAALDAKITSADINLNVTNKGA